MTDENKYYVYLHIKKTDNQIFYVGKGCDYRSNVKTGRTKHWQNIVNKHGYYVDFYKKNILPHRTQFAGFSKANSQEKFAIIKTQNLEL